jgi:hypothetical protein
MPSALRTLLPIVLGAVPLFATALPTASSPATVTPVTAAATPARRRRVH